MLRFQKPFVPLILISLTDMQTVKLVAALALTILSGCEEKSPALVFLDDADALKRGKLIFAGTCGGYCHSFTKGPRDAPYLFDCTWLHGGEDQNIFDTISNGVPDTRMIAFADMLPEGDTDIWKLVAYLKSARETCGEAVHYN